MQEATFLILTALAAGNRHGYGIITDVREISAGRVDVAKDCPDAGAIRQPDGRPEQNSAKVTDW